MGEVHDDVAGVQLKRMRVTRRDANLRRRLERQRKFVRGFGIESVKHEPVASIDTENCALVPYRIGKALVAIVRPAHEGRADRLTEALQGRIGGTLPVERCPLL